ncbi:MAG: hypothetical protein LUG83_11160 [Lachnospiraceae bacterium]|nr:hypothetical protein [Lachnospiraceae bacterium]
MKNKNRRIKKLHALSAVLIGVLLTVGCGDITNSGASADLADTEADNIAENTDVLQLQFIKDDSTAQDYYALAEQYAVLGLIRKQRDILEQSYRLFGEAEALDRLSEIYVNLDEEDTEQQDMAGLMLQNLELEEYRPESLHLVEEDDWFTTMMPKLYEGGRNYFKLADGEVKMVISAGYNEDGGQYSNIWYYGEDNKVIYLGYNNNTAIMLDTMIADGVYDGEFTLWTLNGTTGDIMREGGSFSEGVLRTDGYEIALHEGFGKSDIYDLWNNRESMEYTALDGYGGAPDKSAISGLPANPIFTGYEPVDEETALNLLNPQIRIFDGEIQWLSENGWIGLGALEEYAAQDPFLEYAAAKQEYDEAVKNAEATESITETTAASEEASASKPSAASSSAATATTAPSTSTSTTPSTSTAPSTSTTPSASTTPATATTPAQTLSDDDDYDDDDTGSDDSGSNDSSGDSDSSGSDSGSDSGADVDIEWTDDIL